MSFVDSGNASGGNLGSTLDGLQSKTDGLVIGANSFASAMARAFTQAASGGKQFDDVLKSLALRLSNLAVTQAFKPFASGIAGGLGGFFGGTSSLGAQLGSMASGAGSATSTSSTAGARAAPNVTVQIATPDAASFRRSEAYVTGQIARAVARGQRGM